MEFIVRIARSLPLTIAVVVLLAAAAIVPAIWLGGLTTTGALSLYFVAWWIMLFSVLSVGASERVGDADLKLGADAGAPANPMLREKAILATLVADVALAVAVLTIPLVGL